MDTIIEIKYKGDNRELENKIKNEFNRIYNKFSPSVKTGVLYKINHRRKDKIIIDNETKYLIEKSNYFSNLSKGIFDITIKPIIDLWGFENTDKHYTIPNKNILKRKLEFVNYKKILIKNNLLYLPKNFEIDLGGIAKGYAVDKVSKIFQQYNINDFLINAGGDLIAKGKNPDGEEWKIGIQNPRGAGIIKIIEIEKKAVATSGDYQRYFIKNGIRYHHIISPFSGQPFRKWISMTIIANTCMEADSLATVFFGMDIKTIKKTIKKYPYYIRYYAVNSENKTYTNFRGKY
jgi:thiamine biosynthesis lipoprotein